MDQVKKDWERYEAVLRRLEVIDKFAEFHWQKLKREIRQEETKRNDKTQKAA